MSVTPSSSTAATVAAFMRNCSPRRLLAPVSRMLFVVTGGHFGHLRFSGRRTANLIRSAYQLGADEAIATPQYADRHYPGTGAVVANFGNQFTHALHAEFAPTIERAKRRVIKAPHRLPVLALCWGFLVVAVVFCVDFVLNGPMVSRLVDANELTVRVASAGIGLLLVGLGHLTMSHTPPGRIAARQRQLAFVGLASLTFFVIFGALLREHNPGQSSSTTSGLTAPTMSSSSMIWPILVAWLAMTALMALTFVISALISLHLKTRTAALRPDGPEAASQQERLEAVTFALASLVEQAKILTNDLRHANFIGYRDHADPDLADRVQPHPALSAQLSDSEPRP